MGGEAIAAVIAGLGAALITTWAHSVGNYLAFMRDSVRRQEFEAKVEGLYERVDELRTTVHSLELRLGDVGPRRPRFPGE